MLCNGYGIWKKQESVYNSDAKALEFSHLEDQLGHEDNIKMNLRESGCEDGKYMDLIRIMSFHDRSYQALTSREYKYKKCIDIMELKSKWSSLQWHSINGFLSMNILQLHADITL